MAIRRQRTTVGILVVVILSTPIQVVAVERSEGAAGGLALLIPAAASLAALAMVWLRERRRRTA